MYIYLYIIYKYIYMYICNIYDIQFTKENKIIKKEREKKINRKR